MFQLTEACRLMYHQMRRQDPHFTLETNDMLDIFGDSEPPTGQEMPSAPPDIIDFGLDEEIAEELQHEEVLEALENIRSGQGAFCPTCRGTGRASHFYLTN